MIARRTRARATIAKVGSRPSQPLAPPIRVRAPAIAIGSGRGDSVSYWTVARLEPHRERLALHCLGLAGFETYLPRLRERRLSHGRKITATPPLFPGYCFLTIEAQWHAARWSIGVIGLIMDGVRPARVPDQVIAEIRGREINGVIELAPPPALRRGARIRILHGPFRDLLGIYAGTRPRQRVEILLQLLGGEQRVTLAKKDIEVVR
jgi:transcriptional antiterminator RfaH